MGGTHPPFYRSEDVLDRTAADRHRVGHRFEPVLHLVEYCLVLPSSDALLFARGAQMTRCAGTTGLLIEVDTDVHRSNRG